MVGVELKGRLGNQFFHYAYARYVIFKRNRRDKLYIGDWYLRKQPSDQGWYNNLGDFNIYKYEEEHKSLVFSHGGISEKLFYLCYLIDYKIITRNKAKAQSHWKYFLNKRGVIISTYASIMEKINIPQTKNVFIDGLFENPKFFDEIKELLWDEFTPKYPPAESNKEMYSIIEKTNSVCVTIRRGDYLSVPKFKNKFYICTPEYFRKAIDIISEILDNPVFFFFSDDIDWVRENIKVDYLSYYENGNDALWEKLRLMYSCKHFIISNSTFSWWAQYLCRNKDKIVVSPSVWFSSGEKSQLIDKSFITVDIKELDKNSLKSQNSLS